MSNSLLPTPTLRVDLSRVIIRHGIAATFQGDVLFIKKWKTNYT